MSIQVLTSDNQTYDLSIEAACQSTLLKNIIEDLGGTSNTIPLPNITSVVFTPIKEWCVEYLENNETMDEAWKPRLDQMENGLILDILIALDYLDIKPFSILCCKVMGGRIKGKSIEEICKILRYQPGEVFGNPGAPVGH